MTAFVLNTNILEVIGLKDAIADTFINNATVTLLKVEDEAGVIVTGQTFPVTMGYVGGSDGLYRTTLLSALNLQPRTIYYAHIKAEDDARVGYWKFLFKAQDRTS